MSRALTAAVATWSFSLALAAASPCLWAEDDPNSPETLAAESAPSPLAQDETAAEYRQVIRSTESSEGAYSGSLPEYLDGLGTSLQRSGQHREAIRVFKRGIHLARINEGLYCTQQIPLLEREIASLIAIGDYAVADDRQAYLYRVQMHNFGPGTDRADALMQQASWQYDAFRLGLEQENYRRLMYAWDLNAMAAQDIASQEGQSSEQLVAPLTGMLRTQYLISGYNMQAAELQYQLANASSEFPVAPQVTRFNIYRAQSYQKGESVAQMLYAIQSGTHGADSPQAAEARATLGDWELFHDQRRAAEEAYQAAVGELLGRTDAERQIQSLFGEPVELPDDDTIRYLPTPVTPEQGNLLLQFSVSASGRVQNLERIDDNNVDQRTANRIMRTLRQTLFRPRLAASGPVDSDTVTRAYAIN